VLTRPSPLHLDGPVCLIVQDQRPKSELLQEQHGPYLYILNEAHPERVALSFGEDLCKIMQVKQIAADARVVQAGKAPSEDGIIVHITLVSWYGRLPNHELVTEKVFDALVAQPIYAEGRCRFSATLDVRGTVVDLGVCEGKSIFEVTKTATVVKEGNVASAAAADEAMTEFLKALESHFLK
jgi:hypothetical protein